MRALLQRVAQASVTVDGKTVSAIGPGLLILLGVGQEDVDAEPSTEQPAATADPNDADLRWLVEKIAGMRIFPDAEGHMNISLLDRIASGEAADALVVSQFTLLANNKKGKRPSFVRAAPPAAAETRYERFVAVMAEVLGRSVGTGVFGAHMDVALVNDGPVSIWLDSRERGY